MHSWRRIGIAVMASRLLPITQNGRRRNFSRPTNPWYLERHPEDHSLHQTNCWQSYWYSNNKLFFCFMAWIPKEEFDGKPENDQSFHVDKSFVGHFLVLVDGGKDAQSQTSKDHNKPVTTNQLALLVDRLLSSFLEACRESTNEMLLFWHPSVPESVAFELYSERLT